MAGEGGRDLAEQEVGAEVEGVELAQLDAADRAAGLLERELGALALGLHQLLEAAAGQRREGRRVGEGGRHLEAAPELVQLEERVDLVVRTLGVELDLA